MIYTSVLHFYERLLWFLLHFYEGLLLGMLHFYERLFEL